ncbi:MAG: ornithine carbamoyltransferase [Acidimicrobiales bacterium]
MNVRHLLEVNDLTPPELIKVLDLSEQVEPPQVLAGKGMALIFEKPSARTRNSMEMAIVQLGGHPLSVRGDEVGIDVRESAEDVAMTLSCFHAAIGARVFEHAKLERIAAVATVPVINMLSDFSHPLQALADLLTLRQHFGELKGRKLAYIGDANNVSRSLMLAGVMTGMDIRLSSPKGYDSPEADVVLAKTLAQEAGLRGAVTITTDPFEAVDGVDAVVTDVWTSMGQEEEAIQRRKAFQGYQVDEKLMSAAALGALFLHCLPAHRGEEVSAEVVDGPRSLVWAQAENRMHSARGLLSFLLAGGQS